MSFYQTKSTIEEKDVAVLYFGPQKMHSFEITPKIMNKKGELVENVFQTTHGALKIASLIGKKYGSRVELSRGWGYILQPTPELWTETLPHRTQIIYTADCSLIVHLLNLIPGSVVVETGTGSGCLSHFLIRTIKPHGHLYTFDFHKQRVELATEEFSKHGLEKFVTVADRDVCREGFGDNLKLKADAILLDLPLPWLTIDHAVNTLKTSGGKLCSFSPCIEQVQQTCLKLEATGFVDINVYELLQKELTVVFKSIPKLDLECLKKQHTSDEVIKKKTTDEDRILTVNHSSTLPGHTGYLTVATLPPLFARIIPKNT
ncbi:tRNA (adenine(58)-N(1))-methyltransferase catalytic subunit TRMT61A isoform X1 [Chelonus insularis]|uniref:tRNA (adenine(58)-N(1))-methyltransferase catalytic subunit TRMT61A isoform X1 n=1 Tax=Chelonus insularis TaxID=460826 RepID=UPI00158DEBA8|nr:tRNA (adenine(58)-N(1))-methyltransferase catalytic subunit TRMT61A isoform X1 [Chelonus insularis]XP_034934519.1 tRNA (adenine(58)-N(1))-methyltransferase catalytic subunit TRMT61A isoform X1 [Chelonus insularis]